VGSVREGYSRPDPIDWALKLDVDPQTIEYESYSYEEFHYEECLSDHEDDPRRDEFCLPYHTVAGSLDTAVARRLVHTLFLQFPPGLRPRLTAALFASFVEGMVDALASDGSGEMDGASEIPPEWLK
jgi:hypothetical protein